jgi:hypothetical protein
LQNTPIWRQQKWPQAGERSRSAQRRTLRSSSSNSSKKDPESAARLSVRKKKVLTLTSTLGHVPCSAARSAREHASIHNLR